MEIHEMTTCWTCVLCYAGSSEAVSAVVQTRRICNCTERHVGSHWCPAVHTPWTAKVHHCTFCCRQLLIIIIIIIIIRWFILRKFAKAANGCHVDRFAHFQVHFRLLYSVMRLVNWYHRFDTKLPKRINIFWLLASYRCSRDFLLRTH